MKKQPVPNPTPCTRRVQSTIKNQKSKIAFITAFSSVLSTFFLTGCQVLTYTSPNGERFTRSSFGATTTINSLALETTTNGVRRVELRGYENDTTKTLGVVAGAAVKAAIETIK